MPTDIPRKNDISEKDRSRYVDRTVEEVVQTRRISWGAIFAGVIIVLIIQLTLAVLGIAIGVSTINPVEEEQPMYGLATGTMIWWILSALISLFFGAWAAARLSGQGTGILHGIVTWGLVEIIFIFMLTSAVGGIIGGAINVVQTSLSAAAKAAGPIVGAAADVNVPPGQIKEQVGQVLKSTGDPNLQPEQLQQEAQQAKDILAQAASEAAKNPQQASEIIKDAIDKILNQAKGVISQVDRQSAVNALMEKGNMTQQEAEQTVDKWTQAYQQTTQQIAEKGQELKQQAGQAIEKAAVKTVKALKIASWWSFIMLLLSGIAAAIGGAVGDNKNLPAARPSTRASNV